MQLRDPFIISGRLLPALHVGNATLHLETVVTKQTGEPGERRLGARQAAGFILEFADGSEYCDSNLQSGCGGFSTAVDAFDSFLSFLLAAAESLAYQERTGRSGENANLFPPHVTQWARDHQFDIESAQMEIQDENGNARSELITVTP